MAKGKKTGGGSRKGKLNKHRSSFREALRDYCEQLGVDPHRYMAEMMADAALEPTLKFNAAKELAQYLEPKLKAVEHSGEITHDTHITVSLD